MEDGHEVTFEWPHSEPNSVIVAGTFNQWSPSLILNKEGSIFKASTKIPWEEKIAYKFIVDGNWTTTSSQPTETDASGNINNVYTAPSQPAPLVMEESSPTIAPELSEPVKTDEPVTTNGFAETSGDVIGTVAATAETSSALDYVSSGLGAAIHSVVGIDPINADKVAVESSPEPTKILSEPESEPVPTSEEPAPIPAAVAPFVPITIVPVNAPENNEPASQDEALTSDSPSTHMPSTLVTVASPVPAIEEASVDEEPSMAVVAAPISAPTAVPVEQVKSVEPATVEAVLEPAIEPDEAIEAPTAAAVVPVEAVKGAESPSVEAVPEVQEPVPAMEPASKVATAKPATPEPVAAASSTNGARAPTTPSKSQQFPVSESSSPKPSLSSKSGTTASRKKRISIFGKINVKSIFSGKDKEKDKK